MTYLIALLYGLITLMFAFNLSKLYYKYKSGRINIYSIFATTSLIATFAALTVHFMSDNLPLVLASAIILITTMLLIIHKGSLKKSKKA